MPSLLNPGEHRLASMLDTAEHELSMPGDGAVIARFPRLRLATRLRRRRLRRAA